MEQDAKTAAIILIGNEILSGRTPDKNFSYIAQRLENLGIDVLEGRIIPDEPLVIVSTVNELKTKYTYVITTGGIGPTHDDITTEAIARAFDVPLISDKDAVALLESYYSAEQLNPARLKMAIIPQGATLIANPVSQAPGFFIENVFVLAGVPVIMQAMMDSVLNYLSPGIPKQTRIVDTFLLEGVIAEGLTSIQQSYPSITIGSYPSLYRSKYHTRLVLRGRNVTDLEASYNAVKNLITEKGGEIISLDADE